MKLSQFRLVGRSRFWAAVALGLLFSDTDSAAEKPPKDPRRFHFLLPEPKELTEIQEKLADLVIFSIDNQNNEFLLRVRFGREEDAKNFLGIRFGEFAISSKETTLTTRFKIVDNAYIKLHGFDLIISDRNLADAIASSLNTKLILRENPNLDLYVTFTDTNRNNAEGNRLVRFTIGNATKKTVFLLLTDEFSDNKTRSPDFIFEPVMTNNSPIAELRGELELGGVNGRHVKLLPDTEVSRELVIEKWLTFPSPGNYTILGLFKCEIPFDEGEERSQSVRWIYYLGDQFSVKFNKK